MNYPRNHDDWINGIADDDRNLGGEPDPAVDKARETLRNRKPPPRHSDDQTHSDRHVGDGGKEEE